MAPQKITLGEMRAMGVRGLLIYCADYRCGHSVTIDSEAADNGYAVPLREWTVFLCGRREGQRGVVSTR